jgi:multicomponent Na+:H+ antiporter subunit D
MWETTTPLGHWIVVWPLVVPMIAATLAVMLGRRTDLQPRIAAAGHGLTLLAAGALLADVMTGGPVALTMGNWLPPFGISFAVDALSATLCFVASLVTLMVAVYGAADADDQARRHGYFPMLLMLQVGINGSFLTGDIFNLYVWFEVMLISSFGLLVLGGQSAQLDGAIKYCFISLLGTTFFLIATGFLYGVAGTLNMADLSQVVPQLAEGAPLGVIAFLYALAFGLKAAVFPLFSWLPASYHTPKDSVSAVFAGLLTKVGAYALIRTLSIVLADNPGDVLGILLWVAVATMVIAALGALAQSDLRRMLGYMVISGIGMIVLGLALGTERALAASVFYAVHSMIAITAIYLLVGAVVRMAGTSDLAGLGGIYGLAPWVAGLFLLAAFALSGMPPLSGFWPKVVLVRESLATGADIAAAAVLVTGILNTVTFGRAFALAFWRDARKPGEVRAITAREQWTVVAPSAALVVLALAIGLVPSVMFDAAAQASAGLFDPGAYVAAVFRAPS